MAGEKHGSNAELQIADSGDVLTIVDGGTSSSLDEAIDTAEVTAFADGSKRYIAGLEDATISFEASKTDSNITLLRAIKGAVKSFEYYPAGNVSGEEKLAGSLIITSISRSADLTDTVKISIEAQITGGVTATDVA